MGGFRRNKDIFNHSSFRDCDWEAGGSESQNQSVNDINKFKHGRKKKGSVFDDCSWKNNHQICNDAVENTSKDDKNIQKQKPELSRANQEFDYCHGEEVNEKTLLQSKLSINDLNSEETQKKISNIPNTGKSTMQITEYHMLSKVNLKKLFGAIYLYNDKCYLPLTEQEYLILMRHESDDELLSILKSYRAFSDAYRFLAINPDIEFEQYSKSILQFKTVIVFENMLLDAKSGSRLEHNENYPVFFGTNIYYHAKPRNTPYWDKYLESVSQGDKKIKDLIYEMLGYLLLQGNDGKCFFVLAAASNSGKSVLGEFISSAFSDNYVSHLAIDDFGKRFSLGSLWRTALNVSMDLPQSTLSTDTVSLIKTLTGDFKVTAEEKYAPKFTAINRIKLVFGTNSGISISAPDPAFWNRVIIVPFQYEIPRPQRNPDLLLHLMDEKDDIFSKSIPYVTKLIERNYEFTIPDISNTMKCSWSRNEGDPLGDFFLKYCEITEEGSKTAVQTVYDRYKKYCTAQGIADTISDIATFSKAIRQRNPEIKIKKCRVKEYENPVSAFQNVKCNYN